MYIMGLTGATSVRDYVENYQVSGQPAGQNRLYAGLRSIVPNMGVSGNVNQFQGDVEPGTFTLIELAVACPPLPFDPVELIGVALSRDRANSGPNFGDGKTRIHVEYFTQGGGPGYSGNRRGGWDLKQVGFVPYPARPYDPGVEVKASLFGVGKQQEHRLDIFQAGSGDWWIAHNGNLLGHYPANLFKMLNGGACWAAWYGEVYEEFNIHALFARPMGEHRMLLLLFRDRGRS